MAVTAETLEAADADRLEQSIARAIPQLESFSSIGFDRILLEAAETLGLTEHLYELDRYGYTVVPPEKVASAAFIEQLREVVLRVHHKYKSGDVPNGRFMNFTAQAGLGEMMQNVLFEDPIFERALMNPVAQLLTRAMVGHASRLSLFDAVVKPQGPARLGLHCDSQMSEPYPITPQVGNVTYALTDYSAENGSTMFVPGSHRLLRQPHGSEVDGDFTTSGIAGALPLREPVVVECPAGSILAFSGLTWHGAVERTAPGERVSLLMFFCRGYLAPGQVYRTHIPDGALERNPPRFAQLLDVVPYWAGKDPYSDPATMMDGRLVHPILDVARP